VKKEVSVNYRRPRLPEDENLREYHRQIVDAMQGEMIEKKGKAGG
jgi:hypothetical protein